MVAKTGLLSSRLPILRYKSSFCLRLSSILQVHADLNGCWNTKM